MAQNAISNYQFGFTGGVAIRKIPILNTYGNDIRWVDSNGTANGDGTYQRPYATIDAAVGACTANKGDIIMVKAGHVETVTAAAGLALDVAGISIVGLGNKRNRPQVNFTTAVSASMKVTAANIYVENIRFTGGIDALTNPIHVDAADFTMTDWTWDDVTGQCTDCVLTTANADRMELSNFEYSGDSASGTNAAIALVGGDGIKIHDFIMDGNFAVGGIDVRTTATTDLKVYNVISFRTRNSADIFLIDTITASTGTIGPNLNLRLQDNAANITEACTGATFVYFQPINVVNLAGESSMQTNITASTDA
jgi:hypothetical protein